MQTPGHLQGTSVHSPFQRGSPFHLHQPARARGTELGRVSSVESLWASSGTAASPICAANSPPDSPLLTVGRA